MTLVLAVWQLLVWANVAPDYELPAPFDVWGELPDAWGQGTLLDSIWTSVSRGLLGFLPALAIGTPLGLLVAREGRSSGRPSAPSCRACSRCRPWPGCRLR